MFWFHSCIPSRSGTTNWPWICFLQSYAGKASCTRIYTRMHTHTHTHKNANKTSSPCVVWINICTNLYIHMHAFIHVCVCQHKNTWGIPNTAHRRPCSEWRGCCILYVRCCLSLYKSLNTSTSTVRNFLAPAKNVLTSTGGWSRGSS